MRAFALISSALFVFAGIAMIAAGHPKGWWIAGFFALCFITFITELRLGTPQDSGYRLSINDDAVTCVHPQRPAESILWDDVIRIWYVTTSDGPWLPDEWLLFEGETGGCSFPTEADGMDGVWEILKQKFSGFDYEPLTLGRTDDSKTLCWERVSDSGRFSAFSSSC